MIKRWLRQSWPLVCFAIVAAFFFAAPPSLSAARPPQRQIPLRVTLGDTGRTIVLPMGQQLVVTLPLQPYDDNYWYVSVNSGAGLKLIAGPNEFRGRNWTPWRQSQEMFYFRRESPGTAHLVLEQRYWSLPMVLKVVD